MTKLYRPIAAIGQFVEDARSSKVELGTLRNFDGDGLRDAAARKTRLNWNIVRGWGENRLVRTSYIWFAIVPIVAKAIRPFAGDYTIHWRGDDFSFHVGLPFSWKLFYVAATLIMFGQLIYWWKCPKFVRRFNNFPQYQQSVLGWARMHSWCSEVVSGISAHLLPLLWASAGPGVELCTLSTKDALEFIGKSEEQQREDLQGDLERAISANYHYLPPPGQESAQQEAMMRIATARFSDLFDVILRFGSTLNRRWILASLALYSLGTLLLLIVLVQNVAFVLEMIVVD